MSGFGTDGERLVRRGCDVALESSAFELVEGLLRGSLWGGLDG